MGKGYIKLYRQIQDCWIWFADEKFTKAQAWVDLLLSANHSEKKIHFDGELITIQRGQVVTSLRNLSERWHWSINTVKKFFKLLEGDGMLIRKSDNKKTLLTIVNYEVYQHNEREEKTDSDTPNDTQNDTQSDTQCDTQNAHGLTPNKNDKNDKNDKRMKEVYKCMYIT